MVNLIMTRICSVSISPVYLSVASFAMVKLVQWVAAPSYMATPRFLGFIVNPEARKGASEGGTERRLNSDEQALIQGVIW